jgi:hypothetical protein
VVQVDHVDPGHAPVHIREVGPDAGEVAIDLRSLADQRIADLVLPRHDVEGADLVLDPLRAVGERADGDGLPLGRREGGGRPYGQADERRDERASCALASGGHAREP